MLEKRIKRIEGKEELKGADSIRSGQRGEVKLLKRKRAELKDKRVNKVERVSRSTVKEWGGGSECRGRDSWDVGCLCKLNPVS